MTTNDEQGEQGRSSGGLDAFRERRIREGIAANGATDMGALLRELDSARMREAALRSALDEAILIGTGLLYWVDRYALPKRARVAGISADAWRLFTPKARLLLSAAAGPAEAGHEEGGAGEG